MYRPGSAQGSVAFQWHSPLRRTIANRIPCCCGVAERFKAAVLKNVYGRPAYYRLVIISAGFSAIPRRSVPPSYGRFYPVG